VTPDLVALLTALYVEIDDHVIPSGRRGRGQPRKLSDAELVCLAVAQVLLGACGVPEVCLACELQRCTGVSGGP
jgi:hypothetical protein